MEYLFIYLFIDFVPFLSIHFSLHKISSNVNPQRAATTTIDPLIDSAQPHRELSVFT